MAVEGEGSAVRTRPPFGARLAEAIGDTGPLCVGIDPSPSLLGNWGLADDAGGLRAFGLRCVEALAGVVPVVKPQVAFFERRGPEGMAALAEVMAAAGDAGLLVIADAKRGDIGSTCEAYAQAWLGEGSALAADALTVHPYLGLGALAPFVELARANGRALFVVARSSNPEGRALQTARHDGGETVEDALLSQIAALNREEIGAAPSGGADGGTPLGAVGAVIGATLAPSRFDLRELRGPVLAPGIGAQGATARDVAVLLAGCPRESVLPSASRSVLGAGPDAGALAAAARAALGEMAAEGL